MVQQTQPINQPTPITFGGQTVGQEEPSFTGFFKNIGHQFGQMAKGLGTLALAIPKTVVSGGSEWVKFLSDDPESSVSQAFTPEGAQELFRGAKERSGEIIASTADSYSRYGTEPLQKIYDEPLDFALDLLTVATLGGGLAAKGAASGAKLAGASANTVKSILEFGSKIKRPLSTLGPLSTSPILKTLRTRVPLFEKALTGLGLDPETGKVAELFDKIVIRQRDALFQDDLANFLDAAKGLPEADVQRKLARVLTGQATEDILEHAKSKEYLKYWRDYSGRITAEKVARQQITPDQARVAPYVPLRRSLARMEAKSLEKQGLLSREEVKQIHFLIDSPGRAAPGIRATTRLLENSDFRRRAVLDYVARLKIARRAKDTDASYLSRLARTKELILSSFGFRPWSAGDRRHIIKAEAQLNDVKSFVQRRQAVIADIEKGLPPQAALNKHRFTEWNIKDFAAVPMDSVRLSLEQKTATLNEAIEKLRKASVGWQTKTLRGISLHPDKHTMFTNLFAPMDRVARWIEQTGRRAPSYFPLIHEEKLTAPKQPFTRFEGAEASFSKSRLGVPGYITDVNILSQVTNIQAQNAFAFNEYLSQVSRQSFSKDVTGAVKTGKWQQLPGRKLLFLGPRNKYQTALLDIQKNLAKRLSSLGDEITDETMQAAIRNVIQDPDSFTVIQRLLEAYEGDVKIFEIPEHVAQYISRKVPQQSLWTKVIFDTPADVLRVSALALNPMWFIGNAYSNALFNLRTGTGFMAYFRGTKRMFDKVVPPELRTFIETELETTFSSTQTFRRGLTSTQPFKWLFELNRRIETYFRRVKFIDELTKGAVKRKLMSSLEAMTMSQDELAKILRMSVEAGIEKLPGGIPRGIKELGPVSRAIEATNRALFSYANSHPLERGILRRIFPFWTWLKNINLLLLRLPLDQPLLAKIGLQVEVTRQHLAKMSLDTYDDDYKKPTWLRHSIPIGHGADPKSFLFVNLNGLNPFSSFGDVLDIRDIAGSANPIIKAVLETVSGREVWSKRELKNGEPVYDYAGRKYVIRTVGGRTVLTPTVAGPQGLGSFLENLFRQYPQGRTLMSIVDSYTYNPDGTPVRKPVVDKNGNRIFPTPILESLIRGIGFIQVSDVSPQLIEQKRRKAIRRFVKYLQREMRQSPPELRRFYLDRMRDAATDDIEFE